MELLDLDASPLTDLPDDFDSMTKSITALGLMTRSTASDWWVASLLLGWGISIGLLTQVSSLERNWMLVGESVGVPTQVSS